MRKRELVYLHGLLVEVSTVLHAYGILSDAALSSYQSVEISPTAVHRSKSDHERAVKTLAAAVESAVGEADEQTTSLPSE